MEILVSVTESIKLIMPEGHCMNVAKLSTAIARELGFSQADYEQLYYASMLHDIGKLKALNLPLNKSDMFHAVYGAEMLTPINLLSKVSNIIKQHHECYDGSGFPEGLSCDDLTISGQILSFAENFVETKESLKEDFNIDKFISEASGKYHSDVISAFEKIKSRFNKA